MGGEFLLPSVSIHSGPHDVPYRKLRIGRKWRSGSPINTVADIGGDRQSKGEGMSVQEIVILLMAILALAFAIWAVVPK